MIASSIPWKLTITTFNIQKPGRYESIVASNRKLQHIYVAGEFDSVTTQKTLDVFRKHGSNVHQLNFVSYKCNYVACNQLLPWTPNLKQAEIGSYKPIESSSDIGGNLPVFNKLKRLKIRKLDWLKIFMSCKIESLEIQGDDWSVESIDLLLKFLSSQEKLTSLEMPYHHAIFSALIAVPFKLGKLSLSFSDIVEPKYFSNISKFLELHSETLDDLKLSHRFPVIIFEFFQKLKKLKTLRLKFSDLAETYECSPISESIITLELSGMHTSNAQNFFSRLPNVENLLLPRGELRNVRPDVMKVVGINLQKQGYIPLATGSFHLALYRNFDYGRSVLYNY